MQREHLPLTQANNNVVEKETKKVAHLVCEYKYLAQAQYKKWCNNKVALIIHWQLCRANDLEDASIKVE